MALVLSRNETRSAVTRWVRPAKPVVAGHHPRAYGTLGLVMLMIVVMCVELFVSVARLRMMFDGLGLRSETWSWSDLSSYGRMFTYVLLHSNVEHFFWNTLLILLVGTVVERRVGLRGIVALFIVGAIIAAASQLLMFPNESRPLIGASGIGSALFGTVMILSGSTGIDIRLPGSSRWIGLTLRRVILSWVVLQIIGMTLLWVSRDAQIGVAYWAHLAGFAAGVGAGYSFNALGAPRSQRVAEPAISPSFGSAGD